MQHTLSVEQGILGVTSPPSHARLALPMQVEAGCLGSASARSDVEWTASDSLLSAAISLEHASVELTATPARTEPMVHVEVLVSYREPCDVVVEQLHIALPLEREALSRAYDVTRGRAPLYVDALTPHVARWYRDGQPVLAMLDRDDVVAVRYVSDELVLVLDAVETHPHDILEECLSEYSPHQRRAERSATRRVAGEGVRYFFELGLGEVRPRALERWPDGRRAAVVFTDHADRSTPDSLRALFFGSSDELGPERGFAGHGLVMTKTLFATQLRVPEVHDLALRIAETGTEIAPHSTSPDEEQADEIAARLGADFSEFGPRSWVDHQPETNCEAIDARGGERDDPAGVIAVLRESGIRYAWEAPDARVTHGLDLFQPGRPGSSVAVFYPMPNQGELRLFRSTWLFVPVADVRSRFTDANLDHLEAARGLTVAHTYLDAPDQQGRFAARSIFVRGADGELRTRTDVERLWSELGRRSRSGTLWVTSMRDAGTWLEEWVAIRRVAATERWSGTGSRAVEAPLPWRTAEDGVFPPHSCTAIRAE